MTAQIPDPNLPPLAEEIGRRVNSLITEYLTSQYNRKITDPTPVGDLRAIFDEPLPRLGMSSDKVLDIFDGNIVPHTLVSTSPGYLGLMNPTPVVMSIYADALTSTLNQNQAASHHSPVGSVIEETVIRWLGEATGYDARCYGHLTSGGTVANLTGLKLALHRSAPEAKDVGLLETGRKLAVYGSDQLHFSIERSVDVLGLGREALRIIPALPDATLDPGKVAEAIEIDRREGWEPMAIVGAAGTTAAGAIDPLEDLAALASEVGAWFHVDAAYGGAAGLSREYPNLLKGIEKADSVTVDAHKWFFVPFVAGGILHRQYDHGVEAFQNMAAYIPPTEEEKLPPTDYYKQGLAGTRRFNALKIWMALKHMGADWYTGVVDRQLRLSRQVAGAVESLPEWNLAVEPSTAIVTFRYEPESLTEVIRSGGPESSAALCKRDELQHWIAGHYQEEGRFWISSTPVPGGYALRLNVISYLTDNEVINAFIETLPEIGKLAGAAVL